jgi:NTP pyrophosphatase (non-canonical NTP hydrolase)
MMTSKNELTVEIHLKDALRIEPPDVLKAAFELITETSVSRCLKWHGEKGLDDWSVLEWAGAMCGEAGEAANVAKKLIRLYHGMKDNTPVGKEEGQLEFLREKLGQEIADTFLYLILLAAKEKINLYPVIAETFNKKSKEYGFPERLPE